MAVTTGPQIDLNQIHVEVGGTSGTQCSPNNADIRDLIGKAAATQMALTEWYGASAAWETVITCGNPGGGSPGTFTGYCTYGSRANPGGGTSLYALGTATNKVDPIPASNGITSWALNSIGRQQGYGAQSFFIGFRDAAKPESYGNTPNITDTTAPFSQITLAHDANYTVQVLTLPASLFLKGDTITSNSGCQWLFSFGTDLEDANPSYHDITDVLFTSGNVYIKIE